MKSLMVQLLSQASQYVDSSSQSSSSPGKVDLLKGVASGLGIKNSGTG